MGVEYTITCDHPDLGGWDSDTTASGGVIESLETTIASPARTGPRYIHAVSNGGTANVQKDSWATVMAAGESRGVGYWARAKAYPTATVNWLGCYIGGTRIARLQLTNTGTVRAVFTHAGGTETSTFAACFAALDTWYCIQVLLIRSATVGGVQVYCNDALIGENVTQDTDTAFDGAMTKMLVGALVGDATFDIDFDAFRVGNSADGMTLAHCRPPPGRGSRMTLGVGH